MPNGVLFSYSTPYLFTVQSAHDHSYNFVSPFVECPRQDMNSTLMRFSLMQKVSAPIK